MAEDDRLSHTCWPRFVFMLLPNLVLCTALSAQHCSRMLIITIDIAMLYLE